MPPKASSSAESSSFAARAMNMIRGRKKSDFFFAGVACFALSIVVRQEMMRKGMIQAPTREDPVTPKIERKRRSRQQSE